MSNSFWLYQKSKNLFFNAIRNKSSDKAIVFLHGLGGSSNYWTDEYNILSKTASLYFIDLLGFGYSAKPSGEYSLNRHVQSLKKFLRETVHERKIILVAHSIGAIIALDYASKFPKDIDKLLLLSLPYYHSEKEARKAIKNSGHLSFFVTDTPLAHVACLIACTLRPVVMFIAPLFARNLPKELVRGSFLHTHASYFSTLKNVVFKQNILPLLKENIRGKITLVHGEKDKTVLPENIKELSDKYSLKLYSLRNENHNFPLSSPKKVIQIIKNQSLNSRQGK